MDYKSLGLSPNLRAIDSISERMPKTTTGVDFESLYEVQTSKLNASKVNLGEFVKYVNGASGTVDFSTGSIVTATSTLTYNQPNQYDRILGNAYTTFYQGTTLTGANEIYPVRGTNVTVGRYTVQGQYDIVGWNGTVSRWRGMLVDTTGTSTQVITFDADWMFSDYKSRNAT